MTFMTPEQRQGMFDDGHTKACVDYWRDVMTADVLKERWDHWAVPECLACDMRRLNNGVYES